MTKKNKFILALSIIFIAFSCYKLLIPTEIVDVHHGLKLKSVDIIVRNFPATNLGRITWWEENKVELSKKYDIPYTDTTYTISFWVGDYKVDSGTDQDSDLLCFDDMVSNKNCIEKGNQPLTIWYIEHSNKTIYLLNHWKNKYVRDNNTGVLEKIR